MKVILVYDIASGSNVLSNVRKICTKYLFHIQNSVFEGDLEKAEFEKLKKELSLEIDKKEDSIIIFSFLYKKSVDRKILGIEKNSFNDFVI